MRSCRCRIASAFAVEDLTRELGDVDKSMKVPKGQSAIIVLRADSSLCDLGWKLVMTVLSYGVAT